MLIKLKRKLIGQLRIALKEIPPPVPAAADLSPAKGQLSFPKCVYFISELGFDLRFFGFRRKFLSFRGTAAEVSLVVASKTVSLVATIFVLIRSNEGLRIARFWQFMC